MEQQTTEGQNNALVLCGVKVPEEDSLSSPMYKDGIESTKILHSGQETFI